MVSFARGELTRMRGMSCLTRKLEDTLSWTVQHEYLLYILGGFKPTFLNSYVSYL